MSNIFKAHADFIEAEQQLNDARETLLAFVALVVATFGFLIIVAVLAVQP